MIYTTYIVELKILRLTSIVAAYHSKYIFQQLSFYSAFMNFLGFMAQLHNKVSTSSWSLFPSNLYALTVRGSVFRKHILSFSFLWRIYCLHKCNKSQHLYFCNDKQGSPIPVWNLKVVVISFSQKSIANAIGWQKQNKRNSYKCNTMQEVTICKRQLHSFNTYKSFSIIIQIHIPASPCWFQFLLASISAPYF